MEIRHFSHEHKLNFVEVGDDAEAVRCYGCSLFFHGPAFACKKCPMFYFHKSCVELPRQIKDHPFHQQHPLILYPVDSFVCDGCGELCSCLIYRCGTCMFNLDVKCATMSPELAMTKSPKGVEIKVMINHFSHNHGLTRCLFLMPQSPTDDVPLPCMACKQNVHGKMIYACQSCTFIIHESCVNNMPEQIQSSFHPEHPLLAQPLGRDTRVGCGACGDPVYGVSFNCYDCNFNLHVSCAKYQTRAIKLDCHDHPLLLLGKSNIGHVKRYLACNECGEYCKETFFSCKKCNFYTHLECVPLPLKVKHVRHLHLLTLEKSVVEDDSGDYLCEMCETERNPEHFVYFCEECTFIAHIDCVVTEVEPPERVIEYLTPRPGKTNPNKGNQGTSKKMVGKLLEGEEISKLSKIMGQEDSEGKIILDKLEAEIKEVINQLENLQKKLWELQKEHFHTLKSLEEKEGL